jgi:putative membrane protein
MTPIRPLFEESAERHDEHGGRLVQPVACSDRRDCVCRTLGIGLKDGEPPSLGDVRDVDDPFRQRLTAPRPLRSSLLALLGILCIGISIAWMSRVHPAMLPPWAPWDFSWVEYLGATLPLWFYARGLSRTPPELAVPGWRRVMFLLGIAVIYSVLQTHFDYLSQHMFFFNRIQHLAMHHVGPFLIALAWPGETIARGTPTPLRRIAGSRGIRQALDIVQQPVVAAMLFVGLIFFWLIPAVHFYAMIDPALYTVMNWSMVIDGLLFWFLVMDPRGKPPARLSFPVRILLALAVQVPQIAVGALICFTRQDLYPYYDLCGRVFPAISAHFDQQIGGSVVWLLGGMMSAVAVLLLAQKMWLEDQELLCRPANDGVGNRPLRS